MPNPRTCFRSLLAAVSATLFGLSLSVAFAADKGVRPSDPSDPGAGWPPAAERVIEPEPLRLPQDYVRQEAALEARPAVRQFLRDRRAWNVTLDGLAGGIDRAFGDGIETGLTEAGEAKDSAARRFLQKHAALFATGVDLSDASLVFDDEGSPDLPDPAARVVRFDLRQHGLPVLGAGVTLALRDERIFYVSAETLAPVVISPVPLLSHSDAVRAVAAHAGVAADLLRSAREPALAFVPFVNPNAGSPRLDHRLIWVLEVRPANARPWEGYFAHVDAHDGTVVAFFPEARNLESCQPVPAEARGTAVGGVRPNRADDAEVSRPLPFVRVDEGASFVSSDWNGRFPYAGGGVSSALEGDFFRMRCDQCSNPVQPQATPDESGVLDFGLGGASQPTPVVGNGSSTPADRTSYFHLNESLRLLQKWNAAKFTEIDAFVNINSQCNAFSSGHMLGFFRAGGNCNNTGEIRDVIAHELGHTWDRTDGNDITSGGMSEWKGDTIAILLGGDACVGESFRLTGGPTPDCSGVRDLDERDFTRADHPPTPAQCPDCWTLTRTANNCGGGSHCTGEISGQALWHLYNNLRTGIDYVTGLPIAGANPAFTQEQARWLLERWYIGGGAPMRTWDPTASGTSEYDAVMLADDDDGNLANGTPHAAYINAALAHHEIAESVLVADSANCAALADPVVTTTLERDAVTGLPRVRIEWTPADGSTTFDVYRNTRAGDAFLPVAQNLGAGPVIDAGVATGSTYRYFVAAVRKTGCAGVSPGANVVAVSVGLPDVQIASRTIVEAPGASDGDGLLEPGERVRVTVNLKEFGGVAAATGVSASLTSNEPTLAPVVSGGPVSYGTIPAGATVAGPAAFEVLLGPSLACGALVHQVVSITGTDGCWLDSVDIELAKVATGCAPSASAFVEVVPGSPAVSAGDGDADGIADNCEATTVSYQIRNAGTAIAGNAHAVASSSHPGVTFAPAECHAGALVSGQTYACQFTFSMGGAGNTGIPFSLTADSAANPAPSQYSFVLPSETDPSTFATLTYNFDTGLQGWTLQQFVPQLGRYVSSPRSIHAGSTIVANICAKALSPILRLSPTAPSTLTMQVWVEIEPLTDAWYDRANLHLIDVEANEHFLLTPAGFAYTASGSPDGGLCHVAGQGGWAGLTPAWNGATFDLSPWQGRLVRIEVNYGTDDGDNRLGIYVDDVVITNAAVGTPVSDTQGDGCVVPEVSAPAAPVPVRVEKLAFLDVQFFWQDLGAGYQYNAYAGSLGSFYGHGATPITCLGLGNEVSCNGTTCEFVTSSGALPTGDLYFLVTATAFGIEGTAGQATAGERDPAQNTCAP